MMTTVTKYGLEQIINGEKIVAEGLTARLKSMSFNDKNQAVARLTINLVDKRGRALAEVGDVALSVGDELTILQLHQAFQISISA